MQPLPALPPPISALAAPIHGSVLNFSLGRYSALLLNVSQINEIIENNSQKAA